MAEMEAERLGGTRVLDVRSAAEFEDGHVPGAINIPHTRVRDVPATVPPGTPLLVHCNSGTRSASAVSMLERTGFRPVQVDDACANYRQTDLNVGAGDGAT